MPQTTVYNKHKNRKTVINRFNLANHGYYFLREVINSGVVIGLGNKVEAL